MPVFKTEVCRDGPELTFMGGVPAEHEADFKRNSQVSSRLMGLQAGYFSKIYMFWITKHPRLRICGFYCRFVKLTRKLSRGEGR